MINSYHLDYEGRSAADIKKVGAYRYAEDPSTELFMAAISKNDGPVYLWVNPKFESEAVRSDPRALALLQEGCANPESIWYAWNAQFERAVSRSRMFKDIGLKAPEPRQWRCVQAMSRRGAMPNRLEDAARTLSLVEQKDKKGKSLIPYFCVPTKTGEFRDPRDPKHQEKFAEFGRYCVQDVVTEKALHHKLRVFELTGEVLRTFQLDAQMNDAGLPVNVKALLNARVILDEVFGELNDKFYRLTGLMQTQNKAVKALLQSLGVEVGEGEEIDNLQAETITAAILAQETSLELAKFCGDGDMITTLEGNLEILRTYSALNYAAAKKVYSMLMCVCSDGRVRGTLLFHGAHTGRWTGRLIQPQNFKKPSAHLAHLTDLAYQMICDGCSRAALEELFGNPLEVIASCIRHFIQWTGPLLDADYSQIEARIVCWLAGQDDILETFRAADNWTGPKALKPDNYKNMAAEIYGRPVSTIGDKSYERTVGKHTVLGCGFAMWWPKFKETCAKFGVEVTDELAEKAVRAYRKMCPKVEKLWELVENAAKSAIRHPGKAFMGGDKLRFCVSTTEGVPYLIMRLPSGRNIVYPWPKLEWVKYQAKDEKGEPAFSEVWVNGILTERKPIYRSRESITFYGQIEGKAFWGRVKTYGGKLVENATQGVAADVMAFGAANAMDWGFEVATLIHDQALALMHEGHGIEDFCLALTTMPGWADGLPITAEGEVAPYYTKT